MGRSISTNLLAVFAKLIEVLDRQHIASIWVLKIGETATEALFPALLDCLPHTRVGFLYTDLNKDKASSSKLCARDKGR